MAKEDNSTFVSIPDEGIKYLCMNALQGAHTDIHQALDNLKNKENRRRCKELSILAIEKILSVLNYL